MLPVEVHVGALAGIEPGGRDAGGEPVGVGESEADTGAMVEDGVVIEVELGADAQAATSMPMTMVVAIGDVEVRIEVFSGTALVTGRRACRTLATPGTCRLADTVTQPRLGSYDAPVNPRLRPMTIADVEPAAAAILADDWGDRRAWFEFAVTHPACRAFVAEDDDGAIVGTGVVTINGPVGWIGTIWVAPSVRGRGLGRELTEAPIAEADGAGCQTLVLVATDAGQRLYVRLGFTVQTWYRTMEAPGLSDASDDGGGGVVRAFRPDDLDAMAHLDRAATGEDRRHLLETFAGPGTTKVVVREGDRPTGFVIRALWGGGATIAPRANDALAILRARRRAAGPDRRVRAGSSSRTTPAPRP